MKVVSLPKILELVAGIMVSGASMAHAGDIGTDPFLPQLVIREAGNQLVDVQSLDLFEGKRRYGFQYPVAERNSFGRLRDRAIAYLPKPFQTKFLDAVDAVSAELRTTASGLLLKETSGERILVDRDARMAQLVLFDLKNYDSIRRRKGESSNPETADGYVVLPKGNEPLQRYLKIHHFAVLERLSLLERDALISAIAFRRLEKKEPGITETQSLRFINAWLNSTSEEPLPRTQALEMISEIFKP